MSNWLGPLRGREPREWHVNRGALRIDTNQPTRFCGMVELAAGSSVYVTLGMASASFGRISRRAGIKVGARQVHIVRGACSVDGHAVITRLILEYDARGNRIGTVRASGDDDLHYWPRPGVDRIIACLRLEGTGTVEIEELGWRCETRIFRKALRSARASIRPGGARTIWLPHEGNEPFSIWPQDFTRICTLGLPAGRYGLDFVHRDAVAADRSGAFEARFTLATPLEKDAKLSVLGFTRSDDGSLMAYPVIRSRRSGVYRTSCSFALIEPQDWVAIELGTRLDRFINVDRVAIRPDSGADSEIEENAFAAEAELVLDAIEDRDEVTSLLYADISMNVVDGSSIWLSSVASMLAGEGRCILLSSQNIESEIIRSNIRNADRLTILTPADFGYPHKRFEIRHACSIIRRLDDRLPALRNVVVRGCDVAEALLANRQFRGRAFPYLTDFYSIGEEGVVFPEDKRKQVGIAAIHAARLLVQTPQIAEALRQIAGRPFAHCPLPPSIPPVDARATRRVRNTSDPIRIGYAGKINPQWGIIELLDWAEQLRDRGVRLELHIASGKISDRSGLHAVEGMRARVLSRLAALGGQFHEDLNREQSMTLMADMDYVWCWRPAGLEEHTLELSTKLVEMVTVGARCICYPNAINRDTLGQDYPFYATDCGSFAEILRSEEPASAALATDVAMRFSQDAIGRRLAGDCLNSPPDRPRPRILISGHGLKFIEPYLSWLKAKGHHIRRDPWQWSAPFDEEASTAAARWADVILCEWGLNNAAWHSRNLPERTRLFVRCHAQEVRERAFRWTSQIDASKVERFIFVSDRVRREAIALYGWPEEKTLVIPNFLLDDEYTFCERGEQGLRLGLLGMVPQSKRFDRALDLLAALRADGLDASLHIKGPRPEHMAYMFAANRKDEMNWYGEQYQRLDHDPLLKGAVHFEDWGNDVASWYGGIDHILSPSDHESFHYAIADGVLSGCNPVVWRWQDADRVYPEDWCVDTIEDAKSRILRFTALTQEDRLALLQANRAEMVARYGHERIYEQIDAVLELDARDY